MDQHLWMDRSSRRQKVSFSDCDKGEIAFGKESGRRIAFDVRDAVFESHGVEFGRSAWSCR